MKIVIGADHAGFAYKKMLIAFLESQGFQVEDKGTDGDASVDYPDFAHPVAKAVAQGDAPKGVLICGSGNGVAITANKYAAVRAALCWNEELAALARQHNDANILCIPARFVSEEVAQAMLATFLKTDFEGGRHAKRVEKIGGCL